MKQLKISNMENMYALIDDEDYEYLSQFRWHLNKQRGYVVRSKKINRESYQFYLHHEVFYRKLKDANEEKNSELIIDHIDRNKLNNQRSNLRYVTSRQSSMNRDIKYQNYFNYNGLYLEEGKHKTTWRMKYWKENRKVIQKVFDLTIDGLIEGLIWRDKGIIEEYGSECPVLNFEWPLTEESINKVKNDIMNNEKIMNVINSYKGKLNRHQSHKRNEKSNYYGVIEVSRNNGLEKTWEVHLRNLQTNKREAKRFVYTNDGLILAAKYYDKRLIELYGIDNINVKFLNFPEEINNEEILNIDKMINRKD